MALFKVFRGLSAELSSVTKTDGHAYFCTDDGSFWIDYKDDSNVLQRKQVNANELARLQNAIDTKVIDAQATDDGVVILTATDGTNAVIYDAKHAKKGPSSSYTSGNTVTSINGNGTSKTIKIPQLTVDIYGHVNAIADEEITITLPSAFTITANASDDDVVILTGTSGSNSVSYDVQHAKKGPSSGYTSGNTETSISGYGDSGTIKIPQITVDEYGHVTAAADESITITMPAAQTIPTKLPNPQSLTIGNQSYDGSSAITVTAADLGLTGALVFLGTTTTNIVDASTTNPITVGGKSVTAINGNVVLYGNQEFMWNNTFWELLGDEGSYALKTVQIIAGNGLTGGGTLEQNRTLNIGQGAGITVTADAIAHADTSTQASVNNSGRTYIQDITLDEFGHVTGLSSATETVVDTNQTIKVGTTTFDANDVVTLVEGSNIKITPNATNDTITFDVETAPDHVHGYTPSGSVSSTFTGKQATINSSFTPAGSVTISKGTGTANYTPAGTVSQPTFTGSTSSGSTTYTPAGTVSQPTFSGTEATITIAHMPKGSVSQPTFTGSAGIATATYTPAGTISKITHTPAGSITMSTGTGTANYTPAGSVSQPTFTGTQATISSSYTPSGTISEIKHTPAGTVSAPTITVTPNTTTVNSITAVGTLPELTMTYTEDTKNLTFGWNKGTLPTKKDGITVATGINSATASQPTFTGTAFSVIPTFTGTAGTATATYTPAGSVSKPTFAGTGAELKGSFSGTKFEVTPTFSGTQATIESSYTPAGTVSKPTFTGESVSGSTKYTPAGTVSVPTFSGTQATISISTTAKGTVSQPTFTGTGVELKGTFTGSAGTATATYTPEGTVASTFSGTAADTTEPK